MWIAAWNGLLDLLAPARCPGCDLVLDFGEGGFCGACAPLLERLPGPAAYVFGGPLADAIRRYKYGRRTDLVPELGALLAQAARAHVGKVDVVIAVPSHPRRVKARGFDHGVLLAEPVAKALDVPLDRARLRRVRDTPPQASLPETAREENVRGAFEATRDDARRRVLLVDDVRTTGATTKAASAALYRSGATEVRTLTLAGTQA
ncbi:MAG: ComF family protein [Myxococcota bacterium]|jgi:ComF family protein|nr:ComF family protein [Myxococcota bacterium]